MIQNLDLSPSSSYVAASPSSALETGHWGCSWLFAMMAGAGLSAPTHVLSAPLLPFIYSLIHLFSRRFYALTTCQAPGQGSVSVKADARTTGLAKKFIQAFPQHKKPK